jgi:hypothetical protein
MKRYTIRTDIAFNESEDEEPDGKWVKFEDAAALAAENERLRAELHCIRAESELTETRLSEANVRLATATALLDAATDSIQRCLQVRMHSNGLADWAYTALALTPRLRAFLANQPEAPRCPAWCPRCLRGGVFQCTCQPAAPRCPEHDVPLVNHGFFKCGCRYVQPAAPRNESVEETYDRVTWGQPAAPARTEALNGVSFTELLKPARTEEVKGIGTVRLDEPKWPCGCPVCRAERRSGRGLKP